MVEGLATAPGSGQEPNEMLLAELPIKDVPDPIATAAVVSTPEVGGTGSVPVKLLLVGEGSVEDKMRVAVGRVTADELPVEAGLMIIEATVTAEDVQETALEMGKGDGGSSKLIGEQGGEGVGLVQVDRSQLVVSW
jgi:hypothetical protein